MVDTGGIRTRSLGMVNVVPPGIRQVFDLSAKGNERIGFEIEAATRFLGKHFHMLYH